MEKRELNKVNAIKIYMNTPGLLMYGSGPKQNINKALKTDSSPLSPRLAIE